MEPLQLCEIARRLGCLWEGQEQITKITTDSRNVPVGSLFVALPGERFDGHDYVAGALEQGAAAAVVSRECPGNPEKFLRVADTRDALIAIGGLYREKFQIKCIGVTGSVGKTTAKEMIAAVVKTQYETLWTEGNRNNEIGTPETLFRLTPKTQAAVIEMGMQGLGEIAKLAAAVKPDIGVITNIGVSHIWQLGTRENILKAKLELAEALPDGAKLFLCGDNDLLSGVKIPRLQVGFYGIDAPQLDMRAVEIQENGLETDFVVQAGKEACRVHLPCAGRHNVENALAALSVGRALGIPLAAGAKGLESYQPAGMRQKVVKWNDMIIVEDCYNASPDSMRAALETLAHFPGASYRIAVLSDMLELGPVTKQSHYDIGSFCAPNKADLLLCYGEASADMAKGAEKGGMEALHFSDKEALLKALQKRLRPGCVVWFKGSRGMHMETLIEALYEG